MVRCCQFQTPPEPQPKHRVKTIVAILLITVLAVFSAPTSPQPPIALSPATVSLAWDVPPDLDLVAGYRVFWGEVSGGPYAGSRDLGMVERRPKDGGGEEMSSGPIEVPAGKDLFMVITAYNSYDQESLPSNEVNAGTPTAPSTPNGLRVEVVVTVEVNQ